MTILILRACNDGGPNSGLHPAEDDKRPSPMSLTAWGFDDAGRFSDLAPGSIFRTADLPVNQVMIKVLGPAEQSSWILLVGGSGKGAYPAPWYGAMEDLRDAPIRFVKARTAIAAIGIPIDQSAGGVVFPGCLVIGPRGRIGVFIEGSLCIDPASGGRFWIDSGRVVAYNRWVIDVFATQGQATLMRFTGPAADYASETTAALHANRLSLKDPGAKRNWGRGEDMGRDR